MNDLISRQAAIDGFYEMASDMDHLCTVSDYVSFLESLPSAQQEVAKDTNVPINDCVSRQAMFEMVAEYEKQLREIYGDENELVETVKILKHRLLIELPSAQPEPCEDAVSRKWLLSEYDSRHKGEPGEARKIIVDAPSVQPEVVRCRDCMYYRPIEEASEPHGFCIYHCSVFRSDGFCSEAGRRTNDLQ